MKIKYLIFAIGIAFSNVNASTAENEFWSWFVENQNEIYSFKKSDEPIFSEFSKQLALFDAELGFEFSDVKDNGKRELTISAGGIASNIPAVEILHASAPELKNWEVLKFKQRKTDLDGFKLGYEGQLIEYKDVNYLTFENDGKLGVALFFKNYSKDKYEAFAGIGFLFLDLSLGEYDVMTKMSFLEIMGDDSKYYESSKPLKHIVNEFDNYFIDQGRIHDKASN